MLAQGKRTTPNATLSWYLDRLGKLERYRRQIYALSLTPYTPQRVMLRFERRSHL
jgi:hypothetical protein